MPIVRIEMMEGRTGDQKEALIREVAVAVMRSISAPEENITVTIQEFPKQHWGLGRLPADKAGR